MNNWPKVTVQWCLTGRQTLNLLNDHKLDALPTVPLCHLTYLFLIQVPVTKRGEFDLHVDTKKSHINMTLSN